MTEVRTTALSIPNREPCYCSQGCPLGINSVLVEVQTDAGITGIGEASGDRSVEAALRVIDAAGRVLVGEDPFDVERIGRWQASRWRCGIRRNAGSQGLLQSRGILWES